MHTMRNLIFSYNYTYHCLRLSLLNSDTLKPRFDLYDQRVSVCRDQISSEGHKRRQRNSKGYRDSETKGVRRTRIQTVIIKRPKVIPRIKILNT
ncbi:putative uncharacterized protein (plasmid) [Aliivibrio wodanis]|uniref:Uncharacterized protein n=1 Tax=Aliivibrio wodanis TaxID=80852 RepID=A0A090K2R2_9GAMM|nr:putative uncharacterized protein [Aliivibrio wodanis]